MYILLSCDGISTRESRSMEEEVVSKQLYEINVTEAFRLIVPDMRFETIRIENSGNTLLRISYGQEYDGFTLRPGRSITITDCILIRYLHVRSFNAISGTCLVCWLEKETGVRRDI